MNRQLIFKNQAEIHLRHSAATGLGEIRTGAKNTVFTGWEYRNDWKNFIDDPMERPFDTWQMLANAGKASLQFSRWRARWCLSFTRAD
jgi:hypothetical protein